ncbi:DUF5710 domain-containing protein [Duganella levis]|uniref:Conjugal transfer protein TraC n=1 Tax=Duganella levis TaxID=2692169 RepID=A0ABW9W6J2_9BURK|nr:DUF5710 domain-containing protein [Duganella levis]MYN29554.1 conjugal transfer protein TraC [Duganella levis]
MSRIDLNVPFSEKDEAKLLGARWDARSKVWFVPDGTDPRLFQRWLPLEQDIGIRSDSYFLAQTVAMCWKCHELTSLFSFILPPGHETLEINEDSDDGDYWFRHSDPATVSYVTDLPPHVVTQLKAVAPYYRLDFSKTTGSSYWMNHCEQCGMKQGDFEMHCEPGGAFFPMDQHAADRIVLYSYRESFGCNGSASWGDHLSFRMRVA